MRPPYHLPLLLLLAIILGSCITTAVYAQAVPDTSLNNIIRDDSTNRATNKTPGLDTAARPMATAPVVSKDADTLAILSPHQAGPFQPNPKKSGLYSAILPGLGQLYNRQYWKVPVVYAGIGIAGYFFLQNLNNYQSYRKAYIGRINNPFPSDQYVNIYTTAQLQQYQSDYEKYLDLTALFSTIGYALQIMDAIAFAHLKNFDISPDLSLHIAPVPMPAGGIGLGLALRLSPAAAHALPTPAMQ